MRSIKDLQDLVVKFRDDRDWGKFHTVQNLCLAISSEVGELCHLVRWGDVLNADLLGEEMADIAIFLLSLSDVTGVDLDHAIIKKVRRNEL